MNKYGLPRAIPEPIKREVRQRCGFGCVICGASIVDYEHVDPEYVDAKAHAPDCIALLCPMCHAKVTRKFLSKARVIEAMRSPKCREVGFSFGEFDPANTFPYFVLAGLTLKNCPIPIEIKGVPLFLVEEPEAVGGPYRLSARFFNEIGDLTLQIHRNEWRASSAEWDLEVAAGKITVRSAKGAISLALAFVPGEGIIVERLNMNVGGYHFIGDRKTLTFGRGGKAMMSLTNAFFDGCRVGLSLG